ncbi:MAG: hypothetical protein PHE67_00560 [Campylobacterales bacterium]|nr:hypothetical protein [Campylobacterales bacterium]
MKTLKVETSGNYEWWRDDNRAILCSHIEALKENAENRISECRKQGYTSGELIATLQKRGGIEVEYTGYWEAS